MGYIELEAFSLRDGATREAFLERDAALQAWSYLHRAGLVRRTTAIDDGGSILVLSMFGGSVRPEPADASAPAVQSFHEFVEQTTYRAKIYRDLD